MPWNNSALSAAVVEAARSLGVVGAQVSVYVDGKQSDLSVGLADAAQGLRVTPSTLFQIGSTTKLFTAVLVLQLVDAGVLELDQPVRALLPELALADADATETLTPRHLLSMTSGLDNGPYTDLGADDDAVRCYVDGLRSIPVQHAPGRGFGYTNASTVVSGRLVEMALGMPWRTALLERVLRPLEIERMAGTAPCEGVATGHDDTGEPLSQQWLAPALAPAGSTLCATSAALVRFARVLLEGGDPLLSPALAAQMQQPQTRVPPTGLADFWALGPYGVTWDGTTVLGHSGTGAGGSSYLLWVPERDAAVATVVNTPTLGYPFARAVFEMVFRELFGITIPSPPTPQGTIAYDPGRLVGRYAMCAETIDIRYDGTALRATRSSEVLDEELQVDTDLQPLDATTFLPDDPAFSGGRGWALAFLGDGPGPATHLMNGIFSLRRTEHVA